jgi:hypothetical protein
MKRISIAGAIVVVATSALGGITAGPASAQYTCRKVNWFAWYEDFGTPECLNLAIVTAWKGWDLVLPNGDRLANGDLCVLVEPGAPSDFDGPECGKSEAHEGESEYVETESPCNPDNEKEPHKAPRAVEREEIASALERLPGPALPINLVLELA